MGMARKSEEEDVLSLERRFVSLYGRFARWREEAFPRIWKKTVGFRVERLYNGDFCLTGERCATGERNVLLIRSSRTGLVDAGMEIMGSWTGAKTPEETELFLSSEGF